MPSLRELQRGFAASLLDDAGDAARWAALHVRAHELPAAQRLQIYRNNFRVSLAEALIAVYPAIHRLVGDAYFRQVAHRYLREQPSNSGDLHDFGASLPDFLGTLAELREFPYLPDVARLEWAYHESFHAPDAPAAVDVSQLARIDDEHWERTQFVLHPAARIQISHYPILSIWQANQDGGDGHADLATGGEQVLVARRGLQVELRAITLGEYALLHAFQDGRVLAAAFELASRVEPGFDPAVSLSRFIHQGLFAALRCPERHVLARSIRSIRS